MTGAYMRVKRDEKWKNIEVEYLTNKEREEAFKGRENDELIRWINHLCETIKPLKLIREEPQGIYFVWVRG